MTELDDRRCVRRAIIHPDANVDPLAAVGHPAEWRGQISSHPAVIEQGAIISEFASVQMGVTRATIVGCRSWIQSGAYVGHCSQIGADCNVAPNAVIAGCVTIGDRVKIDINASVLPHVTVGDGARIGAGAVVRNDVPAGEVWAGVPARFIKVRDDL